MVSNKQLSNRLLENFLKSNMPPQFRPHFSWLNKTAINKHLPKIRNRPKACNFIKKKTLAQVFSCEFCENSKNTFFTEHLWATTSA